MFRLTLVPHTPYPSISHYFLPLNIIKISIALWMIWRVVVAVEI